MKTFRSRLLLAFALALPTAAAAQRINTISYGKERPEVVGSDEGAWARNRVGITALQ